MLDSKRWYCAPGGERIRVLSMRRQAGGRGATQGRRARRSRNASRRSIYTGRCAAAQLAGEGGGGRRRRRGAGRWGTGGQLHATAEGSARRRRRSVYVQTMQRGASLETRGRGRRSQSAAATRIGNYQQASAGEGRARVSNVTADKSARQRSRPVQSAESSSRKPQVPTRSRPCFGAMTSLQGAHGCSLRSAVCRLPCPRQALCGARVCKGRVRDRCGCAIRAINLMWQRETTRRDETTCRP